jgi:hypothetical protein
MLKAYLKTGETCFTVLIILSLVPVVMDSVVGTNFEYIDPYMKTIYLMTIKCIN